MQPISTSKKIAADPIPRHSATPVVHELLPAVYDEMRRLAADALQREDPNHTLQPTALVHEAYLRLVNQRTVGWHSPRQLMTVVAKLMRRILVDHARARRTRKRGNGWSRTSLDAAVVAFESRANDLVALGEALERLEAIDPRKSRIVELRFFCGLDAEQTARLLETSLRTVERDWTLARAWLRAELDGAA
jgi:RNA polymerase sigma factor (TIGR02999 family)